MRTSDEINEIAKAMAKAQSQYKAIEKNKKAKVKGETRDGKRFEYEYKYADISDVLATLLPTLSGNDIMTVQSTYIVDQNLYLTTRLAHSSGQWIESDYPVCSITGDHQKMGGAMTYARRYALAALAGVAPDEDADGQGAAELPGKAHESPARKPAPSKTEQTPFDEGPTESQRACQIAITNRFLAAPDVASIDMEWKRAVEQMTAVGIDKNHELYPAIVQSFKDCKIALQERANRKEAAE
jgi:hypothetical protein